MTTKPGEVYRVDLGAEGKARMMLVGSREDSDYEPLERVRAALRFALEL